MNIIKTSNISTDEIEVVSLNGSTTTLIDKHSGEVSRQILFFFIFPNIAFNSLIGKIASLSTKNSDNKKSKITEKDSKNFELYFGTPAIKATSTIKSTKDLPTLLKSSIVDFIYLSELYAQIQKNKNDVIKELSDLLNSQPSKKLYQFEILNEAENNLKNIFSFVNELKNANLSSHIPNLNREFNNKLDRKIWDMIDGVNIEVLENFLEEIKGLIDNYTKPFNEGKKGREQILKEFNLKFFSEILFDDFNKNYYTDITLNLEGKEIQVSMNFENTTTLVKGQNIELLDLIEKKDKFVLVSEKGNAKTMSLLNFAIILDASGFYYPEYYKAKEIFKELSNFEAFLAKKLDSKNKIEENISKTLVFLVDDLQELEDLSLLDRFLEHSIYSTTSSIKIKFIMTSNVQIKSKDLPNFEIEFSNKDKKVPNFIKTYEQFYFYKALKSKTDINTNYGFYRQLLIEKFLKDFYKKSSTKTTNLEVLLSKIAINIFTEYTNNIPSFLGEGIINEQEVTILNNLESILTIKDDFQIVEFKSDLFRNFFVTYFIRISKELDLNKLMQENNNFLDYKWRNVILLLTEVILTTKEKRLYQNNKLVIAILKHLNSEKMNSESEKIINMVEDNNWSVSKEEKSFFELYLTKFHYRKAEYFLAIEKAFDYLSNSENSEIEYEVYNILGMSLHYLKEYTLSEQLLRKAYEVCDKLELKHRIGGSLARLLITKNNFTYVEDAYKSFLEKFKYTENNKELANEHKRNISDMIYINFFKYKKSPEDAILTEVLDGFNGLISEFEKQNKAYDANTLHYYLNLSYFLKELVGKYKENEFLDKIKFILNKETELGEKYNFIFGVINLNLCKYYLIKKETVLALEIITKLEELYLKNKENEKESYLKDYPEFYYQVLLYLSILGTKRADYRSDLDSIKKDMVESYNKVINIVKAKYEKTNEKFKSEFKFELEGTTLNLDTLPLFKIAPSEEVSLESLNNFDL